MAANTSNYVYVVGQQIVTLGDGKDEPWEVLEVFEDLTAAKDYVNEFSPDPVINLDPKVNRYWHTPFYGVTGSEETARVFWDIQKIKFVPKPKPEAVVSDDGSWVGYT